MSRLLFVALLALALMSAVHAAARPAPRPAAAHVRAAAASSRTPLPSPSALTASYNGSVTRLDAPGSPLWSPVAVAVSADGRQLYMLDTASNHIFVLDTASGAVKQVDASNATFAMRYPCGCVLSADERTLYFADAAVQHVYAMDIDSGGFEQLDQGDNEWFPLYSSLIASADGSLLYGLSFLDVPRPFQQVPLLVSISLATGAVARMQAGGLTVMRKPTGMCAHPSGESLFVLGLWYDVDPVGGGTVGELMLATGELRLLPASNATALQLPVACAVSADGATLFVLTKPPLNSQESGHLWALDLSDPIAPPQQVDQTLSAPPLGPAGLVLDAPRQRALVSTSTLEGVHLQGHVYAVDLAPTSGPQQRQRHTKTVSEW